jgi:hypothetical protein
VTHDLPTAVLTERLGEAVGGRTIRAAIFTTFRFEPAFFEQEVLTALFDLPWHHVPALRVLQLEEALRPLSGKVAAFYDQGALVEGDLGSPGLDVRRVPCRPRTGYFHPKNVLVLVTDKDHRPALVVMTSSANLTRAGWWENVEAASIEELRWGEPSRLSAGLERFLKHLRIQTRAVGEHEALDQILAFLRQIEPRRQRSSGGRLHPHFYANGRRSAPTLTEFIDGTVGDIVRGWDLEVISPYVDVADVSEPLEELVARLRPRRVRVLVPEDRGVVRCRRALYEHVEAAGWTWGRLPGALSSGGDRASADRRVHAKVYRFFEGRREILFVGSVNLTRAGHHALGNVETGVLVDRRHDRAQRFWLERIDHTPADFEPAAEEEGVDDDLRHPLVVRYDWSRQELAALWQGQAQAPRLRLCAHGVELVEIAAGALKRGQWSVLGVGSPERIEEQLRPSSFLTAVDDAGRTGLLLVLEVGMAHRPSVVLSLTPAEILQYWALLTPDQRADYLAQRGEGTDVDGGEDLVAARVAERPPESMFDRFAGMFHGFAALERKLMEALDEGREAEAVFLVFGQKPDSLRRLVDRVRDCSSDDTLGDDYLLLLCAEALVRRLKREWPDFWKGDHGAASLEQALAARIDLRAALVARNDDDMGAFLAWYERHFLRPAEDASA